MLYVLDINIEAACEPLADLAEVINVAQEGDSQRSKAEKFVAAIRQMNARLDIPAKLEELRPSDIPDLAIESVKEGRTYAVPLVLGREQVTSVLQKMLA